MATKKRKRKSTKAKTPAMLTKQVKSASKAVRSATKKVNAARRMVKKQMAAKKAAAGEPYRVPWVDETECVGCNLCSFVCPVEHCISMVEQRRAPQPDTWHDRIASGRDKVPGGLADL